MNSKIHTKMNITQQSLSTLFTKLLISRCKTLLWLLLVSSQIYAQQSIDMSDSKNQAAKLSSSAKIRINIGLTVFPPISYINDAGTCIGSGIDIIKDVFAPTVYDVSLYCATPARVYRDFANGNVDLTVNVKSTKSLSQNVYFSEKPFDILRVMLYSRELKAGGKVAAIGQFNYHGVKQQFIDQGYEMVLQANSKEAMTVFLRGGAQGLLSYKMPFDFYRESLEGLSIRDGLSEAIEETELLQVPSYFVVNKKSPHGLAILQRINEYNQ